MLCGHCNDMEWSRSQSGPASEEGGSFLAHVQNPQKHLGLTRALALLSPSCSLHIVSFPVLNKVPSWTHAHSGYTVALGTQLQSVGNHPGCWCTPQLRNLSVCCSIVMTWNLHCWWWRIPLRGFSKPLSHLASADHWTFHSVRKVLGFGFCSPAF